MGDDSRSYLRTAYSALHFEPVREDVEWRMVFHTKQFGEESFLLLEEEFCVFSQKRTVQKNVSMRMSEFGRTE